MSDPTLYIVRKGYVWTGREIAMLGTLVNTPDVNGVAAMARHMKVSKPAITRATDLLEKDGMVTRVQSKVDRRTVVLTATAAGRRLWQAATA